MPHHPEGTYRATGDGLTIVAHTMGGDRRRVQVCLIGEIDMASYPVVDGTVAWLSALAPETVLVDLAELTFACAMLPNLIARVHDAVPGGAELILWRPSPATEWVLRVTDMPAIATIRPELTRPLVLLS